MHKNNIVHRDIKTDNILIDKNFESKISDMSISEIIKGEDNFSKTEGNLYFYPPELCSGNCKFFKAKSVDVWAAGVVIYIMAFKKLPFLPEVPTNVLELFKLISKCDLEYKSIHRSKDEPLSEEFIKFLSQILEPDPDKRLTAEEIVFHSWINK